MGNLDILGKNFVGHTAMSEPLMEKSSVIKFDVNLNDTIWLCQSFPARHHECKILLVVIYFKHR